MSYITQYMEAMDFMRKRLGLLDSTDLYEIVVKTVCELKNIEEKLQKSQKEKTWTAPPTTKSKKQP